MKRALLFSLTIFVAWNVFANDPGHASSAPASAPASTNVVLPAEALKRLVDGNARFVKGQSSHPNQSTDRRELVARGQNPIAIVLACADSRVAPEILFDQGIGDLFVIRNAGNLLDDHVLGSMEYAVEHLNVRLIVALGHSQCGAAKAALAGGHAPGHVASIVASLAPTVNATRFEPGDKLHNLIRGNVENAVFHIEKAEPFLNAAVAQGRLRVVGATYNLVSGKVEFLKPADVKLNVTKK